MRKICLLLFFLLSLVTAAQSNIISVTYDIKGRENTGYTSYQVSTSAPSRLKIFVRNKTEMANYEKALSKAQEIFSKDLDVDCEIRTNIQIGDESAFSGEDIETPCKVNINYIDIFENRNQYTPLLIPSDYYGQLWYPMALANYGYLGTIVPNLSDFTILLNPYMVKNADYYCGIDGLVSENQYDLVTVLLRAFTVGCGLQSTLNVNNSGKLHYKSTSNNGQVSLPNIFDYYTISETTNSRLSETANTHTSLVQFLASTVSFQNLETIQLYNDYGTWGILTPDICNTIDDWSELVSPLLERGIAIHKITPKTKSILQSLGWRLEMVVGNTFNPNATISMSERVFVENTRYNVSANCKNMNYAPSWHKIRCILQTSDSSYTLVSNEDNLGISNLSTTISYTNLPDLDWERDVNGNIVGEVIYEVIMNNQYFVKKEGFTCSYKPNKPSLKIIADTLNNSMSANLIFFSKGANQYKLSYYGSEESVLHEELLNVNTLNYNIVNLNPQQRYYFTITAFNDYGNNISNNVVIGESTATLSMYTVKVGNLLSYHFKCGTFDVDNMDITSIVVKNASTGLTEMPNVSASPGEQFSVSSLPRGYHILFITLRDGRIFNSKFVKR